MKTSQTSGVAPEAAPSSDSPATGSAGLKTRCTLLQNSRSVMVQGPVKTGRGNGGSHQATALLQLI